MKNYKAKLVPKNNNDS